MDQSLTQSSTDGMVVFLVKKRVTISFVVFGLLLIKDLVLGTRPHDTWDLADPYAAAGIVLVLAGLAIRSWAAGVIRKTKVLATAGPYRLCRHPLYLGSLAMMLGFCTIGSNLVDVCVVFGPVLAIYLLTMHREETRLAERHGEAWRQYTATVPRLLPTRLFTNLGAEWSLAQWLNNREYKAVLASLAALVAVHFWQR